ncbi:putative RNA-directed DNA polymerase [Tanacetum coccineum]
MPKSNRGVRTHGYLTAFTTYTDFRPKTLVPKIQDPLYIKDFRPISLIESQYKVISKLLANRLSQVVNSVVNEVQTAYIKERQIIDGPLMVNEILAWVSKKKETLFILKVDFEKAFDSLDWKFLDHTLEQMGFSQKWRSWIRGCLNSAYGSVLVNGSPTQEFKIPKGLRQGDPLSPFLFILAIEALHVSLQEAKSKNLFKGVKVGNNNVDISHLQFADDAIIMGKWSLDNAKNLCRILRCFHMASGLKVNFSKSKFYGIGVSNKDTHLFASTIHCQSSSLPCTYLGLPIGANLNKSNSWKPILTLEQVVLGALGIYYFSLFKAPKIVIIELEKLRRNFFWGGTFDSNKMAWIAWKKVCSSSKCGGLGIGSLKASNIAMLVKWWWRFYSEKDVLWKQVITSIHGDRGGLGVENYTNNISTSPWKTILALGKHLSQLNINPHSVFFRKIGDGCTFKFWDDAWFGNLTLKSIFPRLYQLEIYKDCCVAERCNISYGTHSRSWAWRRTIRDGMESSQLNGLLSLLASFDLTNATDYWEFTLSNSKVFFVSAMRKYIECKILATTEEEIHWNRMLPIKVNINTWRLFFDRLPTRCNLDARGVDLDSTRCPICDEDHESSQHLFVECLVASSLWQMVTTWWGLNDYPKLLPNLLSWTETVNMSTRSKACFDVVIQTTFWVLWRYRNRVCFDSKPPRKDTLAEEVKIHSHLWIHNMNRNVKPIWLEWINDPNLACSKSL